MAVCDETHDEGDDEDVAAVVEKKTTSADRRDVNVARRRRRPLWEGRQKNGQADERADVQMSAAHERSQLSRSRQVALLDRPIVRRPDLHVRFGPRLELRPERITRPLDLI
ncbi:unnamed protein product [Heligmosomoides polygyrus]|uniref:Uncharacterized protein n=1 Tax=Heligmosomoides polygyrus TaxID=6339 RepID=A0A183GEX0_HELPZ|nr:unnamed protein product [Heligmosomoides polygyrus]